MRFAEFFAGGGMVNEALKSRWTCMFANDISPKKIASYVANHGDEHLVTTKSIEDVSGKEVPEVDLMWGSFPCQDLSVAGRMAGLSSDRSGMFFEFHRVLSELIDLDKKPMIVALENVVGFARSNAGDDLRMAQQMVSDLGYQVGWFILDAINFLPQSRPRLFIVAVDESAEIPNGLSTLSTTNSPLLEWRLPQTSSADYNIEDYILDEPMDVSWESSEKTEVLLSMMSDKNRAKVFDRVKSGQRHIGFVYKRTRIESGQRVQRAEVRFDGIAGCLRTPGGGSSRQTVLTVEKNGDIRTRLLSTREAARLMGLSDHYKLPERYNEAYHLLGDGVVVPVVDFLARELFEPLVENRIRFAA